MSLYIGVKEQGKRRQVKTTGEPEAEELPMISQKLREGWLLYGDPVVDSIYTIQWFIKTRDIIADPSLPYSEYELVWIYPTNANRDSYGDRVNQKLAEGWKLYGNPRKDTYMTQPMVKPAASPSSSASSLAASSSTPSASSSSAPDMSWRAYLRNAPINRPAPSSSAEYDTRPVPAPSSGKGRNTRRAFRQRHKKY